MKKILIADSGSTKTDWLLTDGEQSARYRMDGLNPSLYALNDIDTWIRQQLLTAIPADDIEGVYFYGSGVRAELEQDMESLLREIFPQAKAVEAHSDMLGAARAVLGRSEGIASILGTGSNSCLYDGKRILGGTPSLGFILGDEGSGAVLGKRLVHDIYKRVLSEEIIALFEQETGLTVAKVIEQVYRHFPSNRFLASLSEFVHRHIDRAELQALVTDNFADFFRFNIRPYRRPELPVSFVGSMAWYYKPQLQEAAAREGFLIGRVLQSPLDGLAEFHTIEG